jgi:hypothetical protein
VWFRRLARDLGDKRYHELGGGAGVENEEMMPCVLCKQNSHISERGTAPKNCELGQDTKASNVRGKSSHFDHPEQGFFPGAGRLAKGA